MNGPSREEKIVGRTSLFWSDDRKRFPRDVFYIVNKSTKKTYHNQRSIIVTIDLNRVIDNN